MRSSQGLGQVGPIIPNPTLLGGAWGVNAEQLIGKPQGKTAMPKPAPGEPKTTLLMLALAYFGFFEWCLWWLMEFIKPEGGKDLSLMISETPVYVGILTAWFLFRIASRRFAG